MKSDWVRDLTVAVFSFILGLSATVATNVYLQNVKYIAFSREEIPIVVVNQGASGDLNKSKFLIKFENTGDLRIDKYNILLESNGDITDPLIYTHPRREISYSSRLNSPKEYKIENIRLDPAQSINLEFVVTSQERPNFDVFPSGDDGTVKLQELSFKSNFTLQDRLWTLISLAVFAIVIPGTIITISPLVARILILDPRYAKRMTQLFSGVSNLTALLFILAMLSPAKDIIALTVKLGFEKTSRQLSMQEVRAGGNVSVNFCPQR